MLGLCDKIKTNKMLALCIFSGEIRRHMIRDCTYVRDL